jgi:hypothetical protein
MMLTYFDQTADNAVCNSNTTYPSVWSKQYVPWKQCSGNSLRNVAFLECCILIR